jgi:hypothetical protein
MTKFDVDIMRGEHSGRGRISPNFRPGATRLEFSQRVPACIQSNRPMDTGLKGTLEERSNILRGWFKTRSWYTRVNGRSQISLVEPWSTDWPVYYRNVPTVAPWMLTFNNEIESKWYIERMQLLVIELVTHNRRCRENTRFCNVISLRYPRRIDFLISSSLARSASFTQPGSSVIQRNIAFSNEVSNSTVTPTR